MLRAMVPAAAARLVLLALALAVFASPASAAPNDPLFALGSYRWVYDNTRFPEAWAETTGDPSTIIAIVDTGVDPNLADLQGGLLPGYDFYDGDADASDPHGHGTMMAALAGARIDNDLGIAGACGRCSILPVRVSSPDGISSWATAAEGIEWAVDQGARVISISLVGPTSSPELAAAVAYAQSHDAVVVAAAGNLGGIEPAYPAALPGVVSVEAVDRNDHLYRFSNHGGDVWLAAPGCAMTIAPGDAYRSTCGTSVATPLVAGAAGLLASAYPEATARQIVDALTGSATRIGDSRYGRLDVEAALAALAPGADPPPALLSRPLVSGVAAQGSKLAATAGAWRGTARSFEYQWLRCGADGCVAIPGATRPLYTVVAADEGRRLAVQVIAVGDSGQAVARSATTAVSAVKRRTAHLRVETRRLAYYRPVSVGRQRGGTFPWARSLLRRLSPSASAGGNRGSEMSSATETCVSTRARARSGAASACWI